MATRRIAVVGGGTSGSILASWLANNTAHEIVVFEPGPVSTHDEAPGFFDVLRDEELHGFAEVRLTSDGPVVPYPQARAIGGGSAINGMLLTGSVPPVAAGLTSRPRPDQLGAISGALSTLGGRICDLWWNDGRWNPGHKLAHLVGQSRVRIVASGVERIGFTAGEVEAVHCADRSHEVDAVVMCAGALRTPAVLLTSDIGESAPMIGAGLQDHPTITFAVELRHANQAMFDTAVVIEGRCSTGDRYLVTGYERASWMEPELGLVSVSLMTPRSRGSVTLDGGSTSVDFAMLSDGADVVAMREAVRRLCGIVTSDVFAERFGSVHADDAGFSVLDVAGLDDARLDAWIRNNLRPVQHGAASCSTALGSDRRVEGFTNLWVADASALSSVPPVTPAGPVTMEAGEVARIMGEALG